MGESKLGDFTARLRRVAAELEATGRSEDASAVLAGSVSINLDMLRFASLKRRAMAEAEAAPALIDLG